ncbi:GAF domain-containing sensor histidine kinase [Pedobacter jeongneungensis]|uniref:histidine kinase n=1 Tax=Pedobacter jeongneungensis TaxID=947309 RepID=A0ABP8BB04_9SPHI
MSVFPEPKNEPLRLKALQSYGVLDTLPDIDFDELTVLASEICQSPIALISLLDDKRQWFKSHFGLNATETPKEQAFCSHAIMQPRELMIINDARADRRFANNPLVTGSPNIVFYAGVPLVNSEGFPLGTLCVIDRKPRELSEQQQNSLRILAKQVMTQLELKRKVIELEKANNVLEETNAFIRQFALSAAHDIKNPLSSIKMTSQMLQKRLLTSGDTDNLKLVDMSLASAQKLLNLVDDMLDYSFKPELLTSAQAEIDLNELLERISTMIKVDTGVNITFPALTQPIYCSVIAVEQIFLNLLTNAIRYNDKAAVEIKIVFKESDQQYHFEVHDNGMGIDNNHLAKIFDKHVTLNKTDRFDQKGTGIGLASVKSLVEKLNGQIAVESEPGLGSIFKFSLGKVKL